MIRACQRDRIERDLLPALILATGDQGSQQNLQGATFADVNPQSAVRLPSFPAPQLRPTYSSLRPIRC